MPFQIAYPVIMIWEKNKHLPCFTAIFPCVCRMAEMLVAAIVQVQKVSISVDVRRVADAPDDETNETAMGNEMAASIAKHHHHARFLRDALSQWVDTFRQKVAAQILYRKTMRELSDMSGRELADLGLHRSEIRRVAIDSVYGARR